MSAKRLAVVVVCLATMMIAAVATAQWSRRGRGWGDSPGADGRVRDRNGVPDWEINRDFVSDTFTFVRVIYRSGGGRYGRGGGGCMVDYPDSDLNFSLRLQQLTTLKVDPEPLALELTDDRLFDFPFLYLIEPGSLYFNADERAALRRYCFNGGFLMVDDFWGDDEYENLHRELAEVFPGRVPSEVPLDHEIFQCVYPMSEKPQVPAIGRAHPGYVDSTGRLVTWERGPDTRTPHYRALYDDDGRIMVFICHNTDLGDGWEREGEDQWYFEEFSVKKAYPLGINIVTYAMTH